MTALRLLVLIALFCGTFAAVPINPIFNDQQNVNRDSDPGYRLPKTLTPKEYEIYLNPNFENSSFEGEARILFNRADRADIDQIVLHSNLLDIHRVAISPNSPAITIVYGFDEKYEHMHLNLSRPLALNVDYAITFFFTGVMQSDMKGFYKSWYMEGNETKWLGTTQFQPVHARKVFPCFDEPEYKATFRITIQCPPSFTCISNMKEESNNNNLVRFYPTPPMSSYLVAFIVSQFKAIKETTTGNQFRVWARPEASEQGDYTFEIGQKIVDKMGEKMGIDYYSMDPNIKMDQAAIPDFSAGAMENLGLLTYREGSLLYHPDESGIKSRLTVSTILAHEIAHMWFGDLVTCDWWSVTWLNEGFARFFQSFLTEDVESFGLEDQFVISQLQGVFLLDTDINASPLTNPNVNSPSEISDHFGTITYNKGASVIRMIEHFVGTDDFYAGLHTHLTTNAYGRVIPQDLFDALDGNATLTEYDATVEDVMGSFTVESGYPVVHVSEDENGEITLTQSRFVKEGQSMDTVYKIPISYTTQESENFGNTKPQFVMKDKTHKFNLDLKDGWIIVNVQQTGYYRVMYDDDLMEKIHHTLNSENRTKIHRYNRAQILDDAFNFAREGHIEYSELLDTIQFLEHETEYAPWTAANVGFSFLRGRFVLSDFAEKFDNHILALMEHALADIGMNDEGDNLQKIFRVDMLKFACNLGHEGCIESAKEQFKAFKDSGTKVLPNNREWVYCNALRYGNGSDFDFLLNKHNTANVISERNVIMGALGCTSDQEKVKEYLELTIDPQSNIRDQDRMSAFNSALGGNLENTKTTLDFIKDKINAIKHVYGDGSICSMLSTISQRSSSEDLDDLESFVNSSNDLTDGNKDCIKNSISNSKKILEWTESKEEEIVGWLALKYNSAPSLSQCVWAVPLALISTMMVR